MIINRLRGGLGNQLFQYAFSRTLAQKHSTSLLLDTTWYESEIAKQADRKYQLNELTISAAIATPAQLKKARKAISSKQKTWFGKLLWESRVDIPQTEFSSKYFEKQARHMIVEGYWQSEKFFSPISGKLRRELTFKNQDILAQDRPFLEKTNSENSVAIHIRRGDYLDKGRTLHGVLSKSYYQKATIYLEEKLTKPSYFIFSDDPEWCRTNLDFLSTKIIISTTDQHSSRAPIRDLMLISSCQHQIIANSSFSWWGAWLNKNPSKQVLAPAKWFAGRSDPPDLIPDKWIRIENDF